MNQVTDKLNLAVELHKAGKLEQASNLYKQVLSQEPENPNALYLQGLIFYSDRDLTNAYKYLSKASKIFPSADIFKFFADVCFDRGLIQESIQAYESAVRLNPQLSEAFYNLGVIYYQETNNEKAIENYIKAIELKNDYQDAYFNLGHAFLAVNNLDNAILCFQTVTDIDPENADGYFNLGISLERKNEHDKALIYYKEAISLKPDYPEAYFKIGLNYYMKGQYYDAAQHFEKALSLKPDSVSSLNNLGLSYYYLYEIDKSVNCFLKAKSIKSEDPEIYLNLGNSLKEQNDFKSCIEAYEKALELKPDYKEAKFNLGLAYLYTGNYKKGWEYFESRFYTGQSVSPYYSTDLKPRWNGENLTGKTIYVHHEAGFGDVMQFARYLPVLKSRAKRVLFRPQKELESLFLQNNLDSEIVLSSTKDEELDFDYYITLMSLPYMLNSASKKDIPFLQTPYIKPDPEKVQYFKEKFFGNDSLKIGINWQSKNMFFKDKFRSISHVSELLDIAKIKGVKLYSLQKGEGEHQLEDLPQDVEIINLAGEFKSFSDTAAAIENLDVIVTVDTALTHLSGAMGKLTFTLLPYIPNWRWHLINESNEYLWYKNMKVFRQTNPESWAEPISQVHDAHPFSSPIIPKGQKPCNSAPSTYEKS